MTTIVTSSKYQVVILQSVREAMKIEPGTKVMVFPSIREPDRASPSTRSQIKRGFLKGMDTTIEREGDRL